MASRSYAKIVRQYRRDYPHTVTVANGNEYRDKALSDQHYTVTGGPLVQWFEDGRKVYGFTSAEQATEFQRWVESCGIDWTVPVDRDAPVPDFVKPARERPMQYGPTPAGRTGR